jgi:hypothetical protein
MCMLCLCACVVNEYHEFPNLGLLLLVGPSLGVQGLEVCACLES